MPQTPTAGQELHPGSHQPQGAGPAVTQGHESQGIARLWVLHPPQLGLPSCQHPIRAQTAWHTQKTSPWPWDNLAHCNL